MKTSIRQSLILFFLSAVLVVFAVSARAETDKQYEASIRQRQHDFNAYINDRNSEKMDIARAAEVLHAARRAAEAELVENERAYQNRMKRYSMEEVEARDREDDERLLKEHAQADATRALFVESRDRRSSIEASVGPLDPYQEFDINMTVEPETKVSHPGSTGGSSIGGGDAF